MFITVLLLAALSGCSAKAASSQTSNTDSSKIGSIAQAASDPQSAQSDYSASQPSVQSIPDWEFSEEELQKYSEYAKQTVDLTSYFFGNNMVNIRDYISNGISEQDVSAGYTLLCCTLISQVSEGYDASATPAKLYTDFSVRLFGTDVMQAKSMQDMIIPDKPDFVNFNSGFGRTGGCFAEEISLTNNLDGKITYTFNIKNELLDGSEPEQIGKYTAELQMARFDGKIFLEFLNCQSVA